MHKCEKNGSKDINECRKYRKGANMIWNFLIFNFNPNSHVCIFMMYVV
jgi:hypothetical protein